MVRVMAAMALSDQRQYAAKAVPILIDSLVRDCWGHCVSRTHAAPTWIAWQCAGRMRCPPCWI